MENAEAKEAKYATVTNRSDGEGCNGAREERSGEANYSKLPCLSEQSKTISFNILLLCAPHNTTTSRTFTTTKFPESIETSYQGRISSACLRSEAVVWLYCNGGR